jgi:putative ABC transport system permease protein
LAFTGLVSIGESTVGFLGEGMDPEREKELNVTTKIIAGEDMSTGDPTGIILGKGLAASLGVKVGEKIVLLSGTGSGGLNGIEGHVRGVFITITKAYDDAVLRVPLPMARKLLKVSGSHVWAVLLHDTDTTRAVAAALRPQLAAENLQVVPWFELADFYNKTIALFAKQVAVMKINIAVIIVLCISNTLMMSVMERTGEIGTSMALGLTRRNILQQFIFEGMVIGVIGCLSGLILGWLLAHFISFIGIPLPAPPGSNQEGFDAQIMLTPGLVFDAVVLAIATTILAAIYPAFKGSRMIIVDALRFNR